MLCSYPLPIKANRHQKIIINFAVSSSLRLIIHTARHTNQLHKILRKKASLAPSDIFIAATFRINASASAERLPSCTTNQARRIDPNRFPTKQNTNSLMIELVPTRSFNFQMAKTILLPVNNSAPANITRLKATPKLNPMINFMKGEN
jgi:hypothetical protein